MLDRECPLPVAATVSCDVICIVWGDTFLATFTAFTLPSLLAPGNLPDWPYAATSQLIIYTPQQEWHQLQQHPVMAHLQRYIPVCWQPIVLPEHVKGTDSAAKYAFKMAINRQALNTASQNQRAWLQIIPDMVYGAGALMSLAHLIASGKDVILHIGPRLSRTCEAVLAHHRQDHVLDLSPTLMAQVMLNHLHPEYQGYFWFASAFTGVSPSVVFYWSNKTTWIARSYTPEPLFLRYPRSPKNTFASTLDGGYMEVYEDLPANGQTERMVVTGGTELSAFSISPADSITADWLIDFPFGYRPTLSFIYLQGTLSDSLFYDWAFDQQVSWTLDESPSGYPVQVYLESLSHAPWMAPLLLRHMTRLVKQRGWEQIVQFWHIPFVHRVLMALTDPKLFFWADLVAQAIYRCREWHEYCAFITFYAGLLEKAPCFLTPYRPSYAAYLPYPQTINLYPAGWPGYESLSRTPFAMVWLDEYRFSEAQLLARFHTDEPILWINPFGKSVEDAVHWAYQLQYPQRQWHCLSMTAVLPDLLADLIYRAKTLFLPITLRWICHEQVTLAVIYKKTLYWI